MFKHVFVCDVCNKKTDLAECVGLSSLEMIAAVQQGLRPPDEILLMHAKHFKVSKDKAEDEWVERVNDSTRNFKICWTCAKKF